MTHKLQWLNCFWLLVPVFVWNMALASRLAQAGSASDAGVGLVVYCLGMLVYFASWLPLIFLPESNWSESAAGLLAPAYTPLIWLSGIALVGGSWPYAGLSMLFVVVHVYHNILAYGLITAL